MNRSLSKLRQNFLVGMKILRFHFIPLDIPVTVIALFLSDNSTNEIVVYYLQIPEYNLIGKQKLSLTEEILKNSSLNFRPLT